MIQVIDLDLFFFFFVQIAVANSWYNSIVSGRVIPIGMLVGTGFLTCAQWKGAVAILVIAFSFCGFQFGGFLVNHLDIAPQYAGVLMGIANGIGTTASFIAPFIVDLITQDVRSSEHNYLLCTFMSYLNSPTALSSCLAICH